QVLGNPESRIAPHRFARVKLLEVETMLPRGSEHSRQHASVFRSGLQDAAPVEELFAGHLRELIPQVVSALEERHIVGVLVVRLANHPRLAMRAAAIMSRREAVDPEHTQPAAGEMEQGGRPDAAGPEDDHVVDAHCGGRVVGWRWVPNRGY